MAHEICREPDCERWATHEGRCRNCYELRILRSTRTSAAESSLWTRTLDNAGKFGRPNTQSGHDRHRRLPSGLR